jgi:pimeloyl-ACP methyl ester carboxylesterase
MGATVAALYAHQRPERIRSLLLVEGVLLDHAHHATPTGASRFTLDQLTSPTPHPIFPNIATGATRLQTVLEALPWDWAMRMAQRGLEPVGDGWRWRWDAVLQNRAMLEVGGGNTRMQAVAAAVQAWHVPTVLIDGRESPYTQGDPDQAFRTIFTTAPRIVIPGGHNLEIDSPRDLAATMLQALVPDGQQHPSA